MTIDRYVEDILEITDRLRSRFNREHIGLLGCSWGSILGLRALARAPERFWGYVGAGQLVRPLDADREGYEWALVQAERRGHREAREALRQLGPPPYDVQALLEQRKWLGTFGGVRHTGDPPGSLRMFWDLLTTSAYSWGDLWRIASDPFFALRAVLDELYEVDLTEEVPRVERPVYVLQGRHDAIARPSITQPYVEALDAPAKEWIWFEDSAHFPFLEEPDRFGDVMETVAAQIAPSSS
jgi:pimeloyl-ACP methyl ester carboxylesterase